VIKWQHSKKIRLNRQSAVLDLCLNHSKKSNALKSVLIGIVKKDGKQTESLKPKFFLVISYQLSVISYQLSVISYQLSPLYTTHLAESLYTY
jgi:hypothetical protein